MMMEKAINNAGRIPYNFLFVNRSGQTKKEDIKLKSERSIRGNHTSKPSI